ncbi:hypothetical protein [Saccharopolyspora hattusasensis]|uniref:hypothetical protein n=1 Tax=Saccharopolyspora hattusasensis TaxID=1128679 RepID=UPI003D999DEF
MSTIAASVQDTLPFDFGGVAEPVYDEAARRADRELYQRYFKAWCGSFGNLENESAGHPEISFEEFRAAADRLAIRADRSGRRRAARCRSWAGDG